jgi:hypothetical protein
MEHIARGASVLHPQPREPASEVDSSLLVGVLLSMSLPRTEAILDALLAAVAAEVGPSGQGIVVEVVAGKTWAFCQHTGVEGLRTWLGERSLEALRGLIAGDEREKWAASSAESKDHASLCSEMATSFVRTELRADLRAALESSSDKQIESLLEGWSVPATRGAARSATIELAVAAMDSEKRWGEVEGWVRLHRGRIQGRTRLGLEGLMRRESDKISQYGLTASEVLALYLYTGPEFVPMNGICRGFPPTVLKLLEGDGTTAHNRLCTTLFCISSALKKLSQTTALPANRC